LLLLLTLAGNANAVSAQTSALQVQVYDYAGLNPEALHQFIARTQAILARSGVSLEVDACARGAAPCESHAGSSRQIVIRVVADTSKKMKNVRWEKLGMSVAGHDGGTYATVFLKPAEEKASDANLPRTTVLAYAAAHEIGHLLLGDQAHTSQGLMRATWDQKDFQAMAQNGFHFSHEQTRELTGRFGSGYRADTAAGTAIAARDGDLSDLGCAGISTETALTGAAGAGASVCGAAATGAINRYPRRGTVFTYGGVPALSFNASRTRFTALFSD